MSGGSEWEEDSNDGTQVFTKGSSSVFQPLSSQSERPVAPPQEILQQDNQVVNDQWAQLVQAHGESYSGWKRLQKYNHTHSVYSLPASESHHTPTPVQQPSSQKLSRNVMRLPSVRYWETKTEMPQYKHRYMDRPLRSSLYDSSDVLGCKQQLQKLYKLMKTHNIWEDKVSIVNCDRICNDDMDISPDHSVPDTFDNEARKCKDIPQRMFRALRVEELNEKYSSSNLENREDRRSYQTQPFSESASARARNDTEKAIEQSLRLHRLASSQAKPVSHEALLQEVVTPSVQNNEADHHQDRAKSSSDLDDSDSDQDRFPSRSCSMGALLGHMRSVVSTSAKDASPSQPKKGSFNYEKPESNRKSPLQSPASLPKQKPSSSPSNSPVLSPPRHLRAQRTSVIASKDDQSYQLEKHSSNAESQSSYMYPAQAEGPLQTQKFANHVSRYESSSHHQMKTHCNEKPSPCNPKAPIQLPGKKAYNSGRAVLDRILSGELKSNKVSSQSAVKSCSLPETVDQIEKSKPDDTPNGSRQHIPCTQKQQSSYMSDDDNSTKLDDLIFEDLEEIQKVMEAINSDDATNDCTSKNSSNSLSQEKEKSSDTAASKQLHMSDSTPCSSSEKKKVRVDTAHQITEQTVESEKAPKEKACSTSWSLHTKSESQTSKDHSLGENSKYVKHLAKDDHSDKSNEDKSEEKLKKRKHKKKKSSSKKSRHSNERKHKRKAEDKEHDKKDRKKSKTSEKSSGNLNDGNIEKESSTSDKHCNSSSKISRHRTDRESSRSSVDRYAPESNIESRNDSSVGSSKVVCRDRFFLVTSLTQNLDNVKVEDTESGSAMPQLMDDIKRSDSPENDHCNIQFKDEPMDDWYFNMNHEDESYLKKGINIVLGLINKNTSPENTYECLYDLLNKLEIGVWTHDSSHRLYEVEVNFRRLVVYIASEYELSEVDKYVEDIQQNMKIPLRDFMKQMDFFQIGL